MDSVTGWPLPSSSFVNFQGCKNLTAVASPSPCSGEGRGEGIAIGRAEAKKSPIR